MIYVQKVFLLKLLIMLALRINAQHAQELDFEGIHSVQLYREGWNMSYPILELRSSDKLLFSFDLVNLPYKAFNYSVVHCNPDGSPSGLMYAEYADGFENIPLNEFAYSQNTVVPYIHYTLNLPNDNCRFVLPGKYLLQVLEAGDDTPVVSAFFYVINSEISISGKVVRAIVPDKILTHQQVEVSVSGSLVQEVRSSSDLQVQVLQNGRPDRIGSADKPDFISANSYVYKYSPAFLFEAGSEFLHFDSRVVTYKEIETDSIRYENGIYHYHLQTDAIKLYQGYKYEPDINGTWQLPPDDYVYSPLSVDYVDVTFNLAFNTMHEVYVVGGFNGFSRTDVNKLLKMQEYGQNMHTIKLRLKQGYYNYTYISSIGQMPSYYETENDYLVLVYKKNIRLNIYEPVGFTIINSSNNQ